MNTKLDGPSISRRGFLAFATISRPELAHGFSHSRLRAQRLLDNTAASSDDGRITINQGFSLITIIRLAA